MSKDIQFVFVRNVAKLFLKHKVSQMEEGYQEIHIKITHFQYVSVQMLRLRMKTDMMLVVSLVTFSVVLFRRYWILPMAFLELCFVTTIGLFCKHTFLPIVVQFARLFDRGIECSTVS